MAHVPEGNFRPTYGVVFYWQTSPEEVSKIKALSCKCD
jgi:hypothetical protein